jgi:ANTAR domain
MTELRGAKGAGSGGSPAAQPAGGDAGQDEAVVRRTKDGWRVGGADLPDLTSAMVLADLLAAELPTMEMTKVDARPRSTGEAASQVREPAAAETSKLRATIGQLEHALMARVRVEQAIGVLAERHRIQPRQAFEQLRAAARSRGRRVIDIATDVVASATNPLLQLPDELSRPRPAGRHARRAGGVLGSE